MTTLIEYIDRDEAVTAMREAQNDSEIDHLVKQLQRTQEELRICEANLATIEEALSGKKKE